MSCDINQAAQQCAYTFRPDGRNLDKNVNNCIKWFKARDFQGNDHCYMYYDCGFPNKPLSQPTLKDCFEKGAINNRFHRFKRCDNILNTARRAGDTSFPRDCISQTVQKVVKPPAPTRTVPRRYLETYDYSHDIRVSPYLNLKDTTKIQDMYQL
jgi:hypothetical protein